MMPFIILMLIIVKAVLITCIVTEILESDPKYRR